MTGAAVSRRPNMRPIKPGRSAVSGATLGPPVISGVSSMGIERRAVIGASPRDVAPAPRRGRAEARPGGGEVPRRAAPDAAGAPVQDGHGVRFWLLLRRFGTAGSGAGSGSGSSGERRGLRARRHRGRLGLRLHRLGRRFPWPSGLPGSVRSGSWPVAASSPPSSSPPSSTMASRPSSSFEDDLKSLSFSFWKNATRATSPSQGGPNTTRGGWKPGGGMRRRETLVSHAKGERGAR